MSERPKVDPRPWLVVYFRDESRPVRLAPGVSVVIGRDEPSDVRVPDPSLSRSHARFSWQEGGLFVTDLESSNGTKVSGQPVSHRRLAPGDAVQLGATVVYPAWLRLHEQPPALDSGDEHRAMLGQEVERARLFGRPLAVLAVRALGAGVHAGSFLPALRLALRPVDRLCLRGPSLCLVTAPEHPAAAEVAEAIVDAARAAGVEVGVGMATFPAAGTTTDDLEHAAVAASLETDSGAPVLEAAAELVTERPAMHLVAGSAAIGDLFQTVERLAAQNVPLLLVAESGTGKQLVAQALHERSRRQAGPFRVVHCGAIAAAAAPRTLFGEGEAPGIFEEADLGTVFLDEVAALGPAAQAALLRLLETGRLTRMGSSEEVEVDVRIVAGTERDLEGMCEEGLLGAELLERLRTAVIELPPLRERIEEIEPLARLFLADLRERTAVAPTDIDADALDALRSYRWPGNARELRNVIERAALMATRATVGLRDLPPRIHGHDL